jgi:hypothetical protein
MDLIQSHEASLRSLLAGFNRISGNLTAAISQFTSLETLALDNNEVGGTLPTELGLLTELLSSLSLGSNLDLGGPLPSELGRLTRLVDLKLDSTNVAGTIPEAWSGMISLRYLRLKNTLVTGQVPTSLCSLASLESIEKAPGLDCTGCSKCS